MGTDAALNIWEARQLSGALATAGFPWIPLHNPTIEDPDSAKEPALRMWRPKGADGLKRDIVMPLDYEWNASATGIAILGTGLRIVDCDVRDASLAQKVEALALALLGPAPKRFRANGSKFALLYRSDGEPGKRKRESTSSEDKLEVLGKGQYLCAAGLHPTFARLQWSQQLGSFTRDSLSVVTEEQIGTFLRRAGDLLGLGSEKPAKVAPEPTAATDVEIASRHRAYGENAVDDELATFAAIPANNGKRNGALFVLGATIGNFVSGNMIEEQPSMLRVWEHPAVVAYRAKDGDDEIWKTLQSGVASGKLKPRTMPAGIDTSHIANMTCNGKPIGAEMTAKKWEPPVVQATTVELIGMNNIKEQRIDWLWNGYLPMGKLTLLAGVGGAGKSTLTCALAATISTGGTWPDGSRCAQAGNVLIWSSEDDPADTIKPRLLAAGANMDRLGVVGATSTADGGKLTFDPARDVNALREAVRGIGGVALFVIDPIVTAISGDMHKANDVRRSLQAIVDFAAEMNCAVIGITHFAKGTSGKNPAERVIGSQAFAAFARMVLVAAKDEETDDRVFTRAKANNSVDSGGFNYSIQPVVLSAQCGNIDTTRIVWGAPLEGSSREILASVEIGDNTGKTQNQVQLAQTFLHEELIGGAKPASELIKLGKDKHGLSQKTLQRACDKQGIVRTKQGMDGGWVWHYPFRLGNMLPMGGAVQ